MDSEVKLLENKETELIEDDLSKHIHATKNAGDASIDTHSRTNQPPKTSKSPESPKNNSGEIGENGYNGEVGENDRLCLPTFSGQVYDNLPGFLQEVAEVGDTPQETDAIILCAIATTSSCLSSLHGQYGGVIVYPNLFYFLTARAASGKGRLELCRYLVRPIHRRMRDSYNQAMAKYRSDLAKWKAASKRTRGEAPSKPPQTMLIIPANTSATAVYQIMNDNGGKGLIFETEGDTMVNAFESDFGNYSDGFRKAFHHEPISYHRRGNNEDVEIEIPQLSAVLTGTPKQIVSLIKSAENGLFSRFILYRLESELKWKDVIGEHASESLDDKFKALGDRFISFYDTLIQTGTIRFIVTSKQCSRFNDYFSRLQNEYYKIFNDDIIASVRRLGLILYRIAMILSALRLMDSEEITNEIVCQDVDFDSALTISRILAVHMAKVFDELTSGDQSRSKSLAKSAKRQFFYEALPEEFNRQGYLDAANRTNTPPSTAEKWLHAFCNDGLVERTEHGRYVKTRQQPVE